MNTEPVELAYDPQRPVIEAIQAGDPDALAELMQSQGRWVRGVIFGVLGRAADVDDVAQKVWIQVWRDAGRLKGAAIWRPWLYRIARNAATDVIRAKRRQRRLLGGWLASQNRASHDAMPASALGPERRTLQQEQNEAVMQAIAGLPKIYREPFVLKHLQDWSYEEIAQVLGMPADTVETRLVRARRLLREKLKGRI